MGLTFERVIKVHVIRDWLSSHPRIVLPVLAFILGTLTYTVCSFPYWFNWMRGDDVTSSVDIRSIADVYG